MKQKWLIFTFVLNIFAERRITEKPKHMLLEESEEDSGGQKQDLQFNSFFLLLVWVFFFYFSVFVMDLIGG